MQADFIATQALRLIANTDGIAGLSYGAGLSFFGLIS